MSSVKQQIYWPRALKWLLISFVGLQILYQILYLGTDYSPVLPLGFLQLIFPIALDLPCLVLPCLFGGDHLGSSKALLPHAICYPSDGKFFFINVLEAFEWTLYKKFELFTKTS